MPSGPWRLLGIWSIVVHTRYTYIEVVAYLLRKSQLSTLSAVPIAEGSTGMFLVYLQ